MFVWATRKGLPIAAAAALMQLWAGSVAAHTLEVRVIAADGQPVPDVAVFVEEQGTTRAAAAPAAAVMDQRDRTFVPHVLIVQKGASVSFPNSDVIAHHVYSFSKPNQFALPLYKGTPLDPVRFEHPGIVTLGCNIHDGMLAYILVVDTDRFAMTNEDGVAEIEVDDDASARVVKAWSPRIRDSREPLEQVIKPGEPHSVTFTLSKKLAPAHKSASDSVSWDDYD